MKKTLPAIALSAIVMLAGCSSSPEASSRDQETQGQEAQEPKSPAQITSSPGTETWNFTVVKNIFFSTQEEDCSDVEVHGSTAEYTTFIECENDNTYMWMFSDTQKRDEMLPEIQELGLPMLVSDTWVIASPLDLEAGQEQVGGAINEP